MNKFVHYLGSMRWKEALLLLGSPLFGLLFSGSGLSVDAFIRSLCLMLAVFIFYGHVYTFNDWCGLNTDVFDDMKKKHALITGTIKPPEGLVLSLVLLAGAAILFLGLSRLLFILFVFNVLIWICYVSPLILLKGKPAIPSLLHLISGTINFLFGYLLFSDLDARGGLIGLYFGLVFMAGHLNHEVKDYGPDLKSGIMTNAVKFGQKNVFISHLVIITLSTLYLNFLCVINLLPSYLGLGLLIIYPFHLLFFINAYRAGMTHEAIYLFRKRYRSLYILAGAYMVVILLFP